MLSWRCNFTPEDLVNLIYSIHNFPSYAASYLSQIPTYAWIVAIFLYVIEFFMAWFIWMTVLCSIQQISGIKRQNRENEEFISDVIHPKPLFSGRMDDWQEYLKTPEEERVKADISKAEEALSRARDSGFTRYFEPLELKIYELRKEFIRLKNKKELEYMRAQKDQEQKEFEEIEEKKEEIKYELEDDRKMILFHLDAEHKRVFKRECLSKKEVEALIGAGFKQVNEFCVLEKKRIPVLVKPFGNHTVQHEFLVWSTRRLVKKTKGVREIQEHLTRDADLTFIFNRKKFALEIETGNLLRKPGQREEKVKYLNKKYPDRWMVVVSHRDFLPKYRKFGPVSDRSRMSENLAKMLQKAHTKIPYV